MERKLREREKFCGGIFFIVKAFDLLSHLPSHYLQQMTMKSISVDTFTFVQYFYILSGLSYELFKHVTNRKISSFMNS
jgi:hypothetical protein